MKKYTKNNINDLCNHFLNHVKTFDYIGTTYHAQRLNECYFLNYLFAFQNEAIKNEKSEAHYLKVKYLLSRLLEKSYLLKESALIDDFKEMYRYFERVL